MAPICSWTRTFTLRRGLYLRRSSSRGWGLPVTTQPRGMSRHHSWVGHSSRQIGEIHPEAANFETELSGPWIRWRALDGESPSMSLPADRCLDEFLKLAWAGENRIVTFARRWGTLAVCRHAVPFPHQRPLFCYPLGWSPSSPDVAWEPVDVWRSYAKQAVAVLSIAAALNEECPIDSADVEVLWRAKGDDQYSDLETTMLIVRRFPQWAGNLANETSARWLEDSSVRLQSSYDRKSNSFASSFLPIRPMWVSRSHGVIYSELWLFNFAQPSTPHAESSDAPTRAVFVRTCFPMIGSADRKSGRTISAPPVVRTEQWGSRLARRRSRARQSSTRAPSSDPTGKV